MADATGMSHCIASNSLLQYFVNAAACVDIIAPRLNETNSPGSSLTQADST